MHALLIIDMQYDFLPGGALAVGDGDKIIPIVNKLQSTFDLVVATQDWHPADHGSFAANHPGKKPGERIILGGLDQILWPVHCVQGTKGADFHEALDKSQWDAVFQKGTDAKVDSYSGFFDNNRAQDTGLATYLREKGVDNVYVAGLATDYCVKFTVLDSLAAGFGTYLIVDACRGVNISPNDSERAISEMERAGATVVNADSIT